MAGYRNLRDKVVVITGASSGIGRASAWAFARAGCRLALAGRNEAALEQCARECRDLGADALPLVTDVTSFRQVEALADATLTRFGAIEVWVNDAAVSLFGRFEEVPLAEFERVIRTNLMGTVHGCRAVLPIFREQKHGVIINVSSLAGTIGQPEISAYVTSKWAIRGLSECLRMEVKDLPGIAVCTLLPPSVDTPLVQHAANHTGRRPHPMPPVLQPEKVAEAVVALARHPRREVGMGPLPGLLEVAHAVARGPTERVIAHRVEAAHFEDAPAPEGPGNLFTPVADAAHGGWAVPAAARRGTRTAVALAAGAAVAVPLGVYTWRKIQEARRRSAYV
ncbi:MAG: SDR family oxidoreductase [Solirubrobacterales bacterium]